MRDLGMLEGLTQSDTLVDLHMTQAVKCEAECRQVVLIAEWARLNDADHFHPDTAIDGSERLVRFGGDGTPQIAEFAPAAVGLQLGISPYTASMRMGEALDLRFRLPHCWKAVTDYTARADYARLLARKTRDLSLEQALDVDEQVHEYVDGRIAWSKFEKLIDVAIRRLDPQAAREREEAERKKQFVKKSRPHDGMQGLFMYAEAPVTEMVYARIVFFAKVLEDLGDTDPVDLRMVKATLLLANPHEAIRVLERHYWVRTRAGFETLAGARSSTSGEAAGPLDDLRDRDDEPVLDYDKLLPTVLLFMHMYREASTGSGSQAVGDVVRVEGHGPVSREWVRDVLGERARFRIQPVLDIEGMAPVEGYEIPQRHRRGVQILTPADIFPFASGTSRSLQIDHTEEWCPECSKAVAHPSSHQATDSRGCSCGGYSGIGNYGPMGQRNHRVKTFRKDELDVKQPYPGVYLWRDATGRMYLRDCTGTRTLSGARHATPPLLTLHTVRGVAVDVADDYVACAA